MQKNELDFLTGKSVLHLPITIEFFNMIALGIKKEEYRAIKPYWFVRVVFKSSKVLVNKFCNHLLSNNPAVNHNFNTNFYGKKFDYVFLKNGYSKNAPILITEWKGMDIGTAKAEWSNNWKGKIFRKN